MPSKLVRPNSLTEGAMRALEHAFQLADDAYALLEQRRLSSAVVLATFAREELGRYEILARLALHTARGIRITADQVRAFCKNHEDKLKRGFAYTSVVHSEADSRAFEEAVKDQSSETFKRLRERLDQQFAAKERRQHKDAHKVRLRALYVELAPDGNWILPTSITNLEADRAVREAATDCANTVARFWAADELQALLKSAGLTPAFTMPLALRLQVQGAHEPGA